LDFETPSINTDFRALENFLDKSLKINFLESGITKMMAQLGGYFEQL